MGSRVGEDLQKFLESSGMRTSAIGRVPVRNLLNQKKKEKKNIVKHDIADN